MDNIESGRIALNLDAPLRTPVLYIVFKRLDMVMQSFEAVRKARPPRLYIASDGPRENNEEESASVQAVRKYITDNIDWNCEVKALFRERNAGCNLNVTAAISWFFENEEAAGVILEGAPQEFRIFFFLSSAMAHY